MGEGEAAVAGAGAGAASDTDATTTGVAKEVEMPVFGGLASAGGAGPYASSSSAMTDLLRQSTTTASREHDEFMDRLKQARAKEAQGEPAPADAHAHADSVAADDVPEIGGPPVRKVVGTSTSTTTTTSASVSVSAAGDVVPPVLLRDDEVPLHWKPTASVAKKTADEWPRDLESRRGRFGVLTIIHDNDSPTDSPTYMEAAGLEPLIVLWGIEFEEVEAAKTFVKAEMGPWCPDFTLDVVDKYEWLYPTEIDPDLLNEEHRTMHAGFDKEVNSVMQRRKETLKQTAEARAAAASHHVSLQETNINSVPDYRDVHTATRPAMALNGPVVQLDRAGNALSEAPSSTTTTTAPRSGAEEVDSLPEL